MVFSEDFWSEAVAFDSECVDYFIVCFVDYLDDGVNLSGDYDSGEVC